MATLTLPWLHDDSVDWECPDLQPMLTVMAQCQQNPEYHREGNVLTHTRRCCEWLQTYEEFLSLPLLSRQIVMTAMLFHDSGKPECSKEEDGKITSKGHSRIGENKVRTWLWRLNCDPAVREEITSLVRFHQQPFHFMKKDPERDVIRHSLNCETNKLFVLAMGDEHGREFDGHSDTVDMLEMYRCYAEELNCLHQPYDFANSWSKFCYFYKNRHQTDVPFDDSRLTVWMMTGLPGSGKDWVLSHQFPDLPLISLDDMRVELGLRPEDGPSRVVSEAKSKAKQWMGQQVSFAFNATSLTRKLRSEWTELFLSYNAKVNIMHVECPREQLLQQNQSRKNVVPETVIDSMAEKWQVPGQDEGCDVRWVSTAKS